MPDHLAADVACVLAALHEAKAWFRIGVTDERLCELARLPLQRVIAARREAAMQGFVERHVLRADRMVTLLTPLGVARVRGTPKAAEERSL
ncbi:MAG: hypothetical protein QN178_10175 [Armatimonadota bacterium]|nr:hypothetical protein [Armatimonadota bacterium]